MTMSIMRLGPLERVFALTQSALHFAIFLWRLRSERRPASIWAWALGTWETDTCARARARARAVALRVTWCVCVMCVHPCLAALLLPYCPYPTKTATACARTRGGWRGPHNNTRKVPPPHPRSLKLVKTQIRQNTKEKSKKNIEKALKTQERASSVSHTCV